MVCEAWKKYGGLFTGNDHEQEQVGTVQVWSSRAGSESWDHFWCEPRRLATTVDLPKVGGCAQECKNCERGKEPVWSGGEPHWDGGEGRMERSIIFDTACGFGLRHAVSYAILQHIDRRGFPRSLGRRRDRHHQFGVERG